MTTQCLEASAQKVSLFQVDAFTDQLLKGNSATVMPLTAWLPDELLQALAIQHNQSETAFLIEQDGFYELRWFTPACEVPLCGHATLAAAHVVLEKLKPGTDSVRFQTRQSGELRVRKLGGRRLEMDFPVSVLKRTVFPEGVGTVLGVEPLEIMRYAGTDYLVVLPSVEAVRRLTPMIQHFEKLSAKGIIVTAEADDSEECDFVCRYFAPGWGIPEDPVTGSIHTALVPFWARRLGRKDLVSHQLSARGGVLYCQHSDERVLIAGDCALYLEGNAFLPTP